MERPKRIQNPPYWTPLGAAIVMPGTDGVKWPPHRGSAAAGVGQPEALIAENGGFRHGSKNISHSKFWDRLLAEAKLREA